jgi:hypothetical protein
LLRRGGEADLVARPPTFGASPERTPPLTQRLDMRHSSSTDGDTRRAALRRRLG